MELICIPLRRDAATIRAQRTVSGQEGRSNGGTTIGSPATCTTVLPAENIIGEGIYTRRNIEEDDDSIPGLFLKLTCWLRHGINSPFTL